ncbi:unnamed protein product [Paramecium pentaurelia]|uniref:UBR-type domain-containing protein n=1 Tax=Paramecium pentaurelia TaxID=43138 RepID=A0A8S1XUI2_9CILI|nr:unnamed protein product [Paramecium pentaurelia]
MQSKEFIQQALEDLYYNHQGKLEMDELYNLLISKHSQDQQDITQKVHSVCGAQIDKGSLSFQCFDCSGDFNHMICIKCFDIKKHINHKFALRDSSGCCDCGDINSLNLGICDHHQGHAKINKQEIIAQISEDVQNNTQIFLKCLNNILNQLYLEIKPKSTNIPFYVKIYHLAVKKNFTKLIDIIQLQDYYESFNKALFYHNILIQYISWFIEVNHKNLFLITSILQQIDENSNQMILENIFERQLVLESLGPFQGEKIEKIFYAFHADDEFKQLTHVIFMNNYHKLHYFLFENQKVFKLLQGIYEDLENYDEEQNNINLQTIENTVAQQIQQEKLDNNHNFVQIYITTFRGQHTQFCTQKMLEIFFLPQNCSHYLQSLIKCQDIYFKDIDFGQDFSFLHLNLLSFRLDCTWFKYALINSLKQVLDDKFDSFQENIITQNDYEDFQKRQFIFTQLIHSFYNVKKQQQNYQIDKLGVQQNDLINAALIISYQSLQLNIFNRMFQSLRSLMPKIIGKRNLSRIILQQCYQKLNQDIQNYMNFEQIDNFYLNYLNTEFTSQNQKQICDSYNKLSLKLLKRPIIANLIFIELLVLEYFEGSFKDKQQFLNHLMQVLRIENLQDLRLLFNYLLVDSLQNLITFNFDQQKRLYFKYSSINKIQSQMESIDLACIKLYLFLFEQDGLQFFDEIFKKFRIPDKIIESQIYNFILLSIMASELEFWNVLQMVEEKIDIYPDELKSAINYTIINIFNLSSSLSYTDIEKYVQQLKIKTDQSLQNFVQQVCQLDQISKKFTLKKDLQLYFDPILFYKNKTIYGQLLDRLIDQRKSQEFINFGNYIQYRADDIIKQMKQNSNSIFFDIFILLTNKPFITQLIQKIQQQQTLQAYQLLNYLIIILSKQQNKIDEELFELIQSLIQHQSQNDQKGAEYLNQIINNLKQLFEKESNTFKEQNIQKQVFDKSKMKNKYLEKQIQFNNQLDVNLQSELLQQKFDENDYCQSCKLHLNNNDKYTPIFIQTFAKQSLYEIMPTALHNELNAQAFNLLNISSCKHQFHFECLTKSFKNLYQQNLPQWISSHCPICQQSCNILLPMTELDIHFDQFNLEVQAVLIELNLDQQFFQKYKDQENLILFEIFYQILNNILIQIFVQKVDFQRSSKIQIFQQFFKILQYTYNKINYKQNILNFKRGQIFILDLLLLIENYVMKLISKNDYEQEISNILLSLPVQNDDIVKILFSCFDIEFNEKLFKQEKNTKQLSFITDFYQIQNEISNQIAILLGNNFEIFRHRYIKNLCKKCGFFNYNFQKSKDIALCLLCLKTFCLGSCQNKQFGNLTIHIEEEHNGHSIYVCLSSGKVIITSYPIQLVNFLTLFYNNLGQELEQITYHNQDWNNYKLDMEKVDQISKIILLNQYQHIVRNALNDQNRQNIRRNL